MAAERDEPQSRDGIETAASLACKLTETESEPCQCPRCLAVVALSEHTCCRCGECLTCG